MSKGFDIRNIPEIKEMEIKARSKTDSHKLNERQEQVFRDILDLFNTANKLQKNIYELNLLSSIESRCYAERLKESLCEVKQLQEKYNNAFPATDGFKTITAYAMDASGDKSGYSSANICQETNDVTAAIASCTSKTRLYDPTYDETLVPPSLKLYIGPDSFHKDSHILNIEDSEVSNALDGNVNSVWFRRILTDTSVTEIVNEFVIGLPEDIVTSRLVNQIIIYPFPTGWTDIMDVQYKSGGAWKTVDGFKTHEGFEEEEYTDIFGNRLIRGTIKDSPNLRLCFKPVQTNQIKVVLRQRHFTFDAANNRREWFVGIRDISVDYVRYSREESFFEMEYEFPKKEGSVKVYDTEIVCNNKPDPNVLKNIFKDYYYYDEENNPHKITDSLPFVLCGKKMKVRFTIDGTSDTPNICKCMVKYKIV